MKKRTAIHSIVLSLSILLFAYSLLISPYRYAWEPLLKEVNHNAVLILKLIYAFLIIVLGIAIAAIWKSKGWIKFAYLILLAIVAYKMVAVFSI